MQKWTSRGKFTVFLLQWPVFAFKIDRNWAEILTSSGRKRTMNANPTPGAELLYEISDGIGRITFNRPEARNSLTFNMYERLAEICAGAGKNRSLKVLILTG